MTDVRNHSQQTLSRRNMNKYRRILFTLIFSFVISFIPTLNTFAQAQVGDTIEVRNPRGYNIRTGTSTSSSSLGYLLQGQTFIVEDVVQGENISGFSNIWYKTTINKNTGYIIMDPDTSKQHIIPVETQETTPAPTPTVAPTPTPPPYVPDDETGKPAYTDAQWQQVLKAFPSSYHEQLNVLHRDHPSWKFEAVYHDYDLEFAATIQLENPARNIVPYNFREYRDFNYPNQQDAGGWYAANRAGLLFTMDPRNWLTEKYIFMFEKLSEVENAPAERRLQYMFSGNQDLLDMIPGIISASRAHGVSPIFVGSRILTEVQTRYNGVLTVTAPAKGTRKISQEEINLLGITADPNANYYNVFNIGAYQGSDPQKNAVLYAMGYNNGVTSPNVMARYSLPWDTQYKAIYGGITFIKEAYLDKGQNSNYYMKYNLRPSRNNLRANVWHQYMGNIFAPATEASVQYSSNVKADALDLGYTFIIPVFQNMDQYRYPNPGTRYPDSVPSPQPSTDDQDYDIGEQKPFGNTGDQLLITSANGYNMRAQATTNSNRVGGVANNEIVTILERVTGQQVSGATDQWYKVRNTSGVEGYINAYPPSQVLIKKTETTVLLGDVDGDKRLTVGDIVDIRMYILGLKNLNAEQQKAGDVDGDGRLTVGDIVDIRLHILGIKRLF